MNKTTRRIIFITYCIVALPIYFLWKSYDLKTGAGLGSGFLRGAIVFGPLAVLWGWVKGSGEK